METKVMETVRWKIKYLETQKRRAMEDIELKNTLIQRVETEIVALKKEYSL